MTLVKIGTDEGGDFARKPALDDIKAYLAEQGLVAVPVEVTEASPSLCAIVVAYDDWYKDHDRTLTDLCQAMIKAAGEGL